MLGLGAFGLAFSLTTTAAYLPPLLGKFTSSTTLIALVLAAEGLFAITLPLVIGPWSDSFHTPLGRRRPFMLVALGPICFCLALMAFMPSLWTTALLVFAFFFAYYVYEPPYRGLYPDLLPERLYGRAQSAQHLMRGLALGIGADRRQRPLPRLAGLSVPRCGGRRHGGLRLAGALPARGRRPRSRLRRRPGLSQPQLATCSGATPRCVAS